MLSSPVWRGHARYAFCAGLLLGALTTALAVLLAGSLLRLPAPPAVWRWVVAGAVAVLILRELGVLRFRLPQNARQVPDFVHRHGPLFGPLQFGFELGTSVRTYTPSALPHATALAVLLLAGPAAAVVTGLAFGAGRSLMVLGNLRYSDDNSWDAAWTARHRWIRLILVVAFAAGALTLLR